MAPRSTKRTKPKLTYDRISQQFVVDCLRPHPEGSQWTPRDTRFVLWYHLTTILTFTSIAIAHNVTFPDDEPQMNERDVANIIEVVLNNNVPLIKNDLAPNGHWNRPTEQGWIPCDHEMICSKLAIQNRGRKSVMRNTECRTRSEREARGIAEMLWQGSWPEILSCPREHVADSGTSSHGSDKENRNPASPSAYLATFRAAAAAVASLASRSNNSSARSRGSQRTRLSPKSPPFAWSSNEDGSYVRKDGSPNPSNLASNPSNPASNPTNSASAKSATNSSSSASFKSARSNRSLHERPTGQAVEIVAANETGDPMPVTWCRQSIAFMDGASAFWYVFQMTTVLLYWAFFLSSFPELHWPEEYLRSLTWPRLFMLFCTMLGAYHVVSAALAAFRGALGRWWGIEINRLGTPGLSRTTHMLGSVLAAALTALICRCLGILDDGWRFS
ncbi:hypothetical protein EDD36DRAFT_423826 [Exophiala viscosa]|uniref:Uncharacterized protein n=1 Tax=Exophiala viscosa TaxID=2486360 RepID=A0AAN6DMH4_9EURO|nr:hypothetical protein EDD36DRAFT_423826 [Exophiala viscosa]